MRHLVAWISNDHNASNIIKEVDILEAIKWAAAALEEVSEMAITNCFSKCRIVQKVAENGESDLNKYFTKIFILL